MSKSPYIQELKNLTEQQMDEYIRINYIIVKFDKVLDAITNQPGYLFVPNYLHSITSLDYNITAQTVISMFIKGSLDVNYTGSKKIVEILNTVTDEGAVMKVFEEIINVLPKIREVLNIRKLLYSNVINVLGIGVNNQQGPIVNHDQKTAIQNHLSPFEIEIFNTLRSSNYSYEHYDTLNFYYFYIMNKDIVTLTGSYTDNTTIDSIVIEHMESAFARYINDTYKVQIDNETTKTNAIKIVYSRYNPYYEKIYNILEKYKQTRMDTSYGGSKKTKQRKQKKTKRAKRTKRTKRTRQNKK